MTKQSSFIPNAFQTPNGYVDEVMPYLTGEEFKVLIYAVRRILGFQKRQDRISVSQFTNGITNKDGDELDRGTGLSNATVSKCLASLTEYGLLVRMGENDPKKNDGTLWSLQWEEGGVNLDALKERKAKKEKAQAKKMKKARSMRHTPPNGIERTPPNGIETQYTREIQGKPVKEGAGAQTPSHKKPLKANQIPQIVLFREVTRRYPSSGSQFTVITSVDKMCDRLGRDAVVKDLEPFYREWCDRGYNPTSVKWLEWAVSGAIPTNGKAPQVTHTNNVIDQVLGVGQYGD